MQSQINHKTPKIICLNKPAHKNNDVIVFVANLCCR